MFPVSLKGMNYHFSASDCTWTSFYPGKEVCVCALGVVRRWGKEEMRINHIYWNEWSSWLKGCTEVHLMFIKSLIHFESCKFTVNVAGTSIFAVLYDVFQSETGHTIFAAFGTHWVQLPRISLISKESFI